MIALIITFCRIMISSNIFFSSFQIFVFYSPVFLFFSPVEIKEIEGRLNKFDKVTKFREHKREKNVEKFFL